VDKLNRRSSDVLKAEAEIEKLNDVQTLDADLGLKLYNGSRNSRGTAAQIMRSRRYVGLQFWGRCNQERAG
jgi:hypothetical protein